MARASLRTLLPLDRWAFHLGLEPRHFNGVTTALRPARACHNAWMQYAWQNSDRVGREDVAQAIQQAESDIMQLLGFSPVPGWVAGEVIRTARHRDSTMLQPSSLMNPRGLFQSVTTSLGYVISGGIRASAVIGVASIAGGSMVWIDLDADGYSEIVRITLPTTVTDENEIRCYFTGHDQEDEWEIRPLRAVTIAGGNVVIDIDRHLLVDPNLWEALDARAVDGDVDGNFVIDIDVYRVYNDPSQQVQLQWERYPGQCGCGSATCAMCAWSTQWGCLQCRDPKMGYVTYQPATWNASTEQYDAASIAVGRQPERVRLWYHAGYEGSRVARPMVEMDPLFERIITYYSVTLLDRPVCNCSEVENFVGRWRNDLALQGDASYQMSRRAIACPWGTMAGAIWAYEQTLKYALEGR